MKNLWVIMLTLLMTVSLAAQELAADDRLTITQSTKPYIGVYTFGYQGLPMSGYPQFQLNNYGGIPGTATATADNSILGLFSFSGHNGSAKKTVGIIRVKSMTDFAANLSARMDFLIGPNREQRMTILGNSGDIGMGTENPSRSLEVHRSGSNAAIEISTDNSNSGSAQLFLRTNETFKDEVHLRKWGSAAGGMITGSSIPVANLTALRANTDAGSMMLGTVGSNPLYLISNDEVGLYMDASQKIGMGTLTPSTKLDVDGQIRMRAGASIGYVPVSDADGVMTWTDPSTFVPSSPWTEDGGDIHRLSGNVGVGTDTPGSLLHIKGDPLNPSGIGHYTSVFIENSYVGNFSKYGLVSSCVNNPGYGYGGFFRGGRIGIYGYNDIGDYTGTGWGIQARSEGTAGARIALEADAQNYGGNLSYGVHSDASGATTNYGVRGHAAGGTTNYGIYGNASGGTTNWAGYFTKEDDGTSVFIENEGNSGSGNVTGSGLEIEAGYVGLRVGLNKTFKAGTRYNISAVTTTTGTNLAGYHYGIYAYANGSREAIGGNYSIYGFEGASSGAGTNWAGYFVGDVRVTGTFSNISDSKLKKDIKDIDNALDIIKELQPKSYDFKTNEYPHMMLDEKPQLGFLAQELEEVLPQLVKTAIHPEHVNRDGKDTGIPNSPAVEVKSINYIGVIPILTQGIKELSEEIEEKDELIEGMQSEINALSKENLELTNRLDQLTALVNERFDEMEKSMSSCCLNEVESKVDEKNTNIHLNGLDMAKLEQNAPNPFHEETIIKYYIPSSSKNGLLTITDIKGSPLKSVNLENTGFGTVTIHANELPTGTYIYTLFVDGKQVESRQMVLVK